MYSWVEEGATWTGDDVNTCLFKVVGDTDEKPEANAIKHPTQRRKKGRFRGNILLLFSSGRYAMNY